MTRSVTSLGSGSRHSSLFRFQIWHIALLVAFVAIAIVDIQDNRRGEPVLIALAAAGYAAYALIVWVAWNYVRRWEARLGWLLALSIYLAAMGVVYLAAVIVYLRAEDAILHGRLF